MARRPRRPKNKYPHVQERIEKLLDSPLHELAVKLKWLTDFKHEQIIEFVSKLLERVPKECNRHFHFNAWMIQSIVQSWSDSPRLHSRMIIPTHYHEWGYERIPILTNSTVDSSFAVSFIHIPSEVSKEIPSLLDYSWLCHELGHHFLTLHGHYDKLFNEFLPHLDRCISELTRMSISDRGLAKTQSQAVIKEIEAKWKSSEWVQELAIDVIALWGCGPAYLAAFEEAHEDTDNPFIIESNHPPVELRTYALLHAAQKLGWDKHLKKLEQIRQDWYKKIPGQIRNQYESLRNPELVTQCVAAALTYCENIGIPRLKLADLNKIRLNLHQGNDFSDGIELIVAAWLSYHENGECYYNWEEQTFNQLTDEIVQESVK